jgi:hypothetical protein
LNGVFGQVLLVLLCTMGQTGAAVLSGNCAHCLDISEFVRGGVNAMCVVVVKQLFPTSADWKIAGHENTLTHV